MMTDLQRELWERYGEQFIRLSRNLDIGEENVVKGIFGEEWPNNADRSTRQSLGRAISAAFDSEEFDDQLNHLTKAGTNGTPNRQLYRRIK